MLKGAEIDSLIKTMLQLEMDLKNIDKRISLIMFLSKLEPSRFKQHIKKSGLFLDRMDRLEMISNFTRL